MTDVPAAVTSALTRRRDEGTLEARERMLAARVSEGDLRVIQALPHRTADPRIGLILRVDPENEFVEVLLVHSAPELASDRDVILPAAVTSAPYDTVVQTDLRAAVWSLQLGKRIGHIDQLALAAVRAIDDRASSRKLAATPTHAIQELSGGTRLAGPLDPRWSFKESEGVALRRLAIDCTEALLDQGLVWDVDPRLLQAELLDRADDPESLVIELLHWVQTRRLSLTDDNLDFLLVAGALEIDSWSQFSDLGVDMLMALQEIVLGAATGVGVVRADALCLLTAAHLDPIDSIESLQRIHYLAAKEPVLS